MWRSLVLFVFTQLFRIQDDGRGGGREKAIKSISLVELNMRMELMMLNQIS